MADYLERSLGNQLMARSGKTGKVTGNCAVTLRARLMLDSADVHHRVCASFKRIDCLNSGVDIVQEEILPCFTKGSRVHVALGSGACSVVRLRWARKTTCLRGGPSGTLLLS